MKGYYWQVTEDSKDKEFDEFVRCSDCGDKAKVKQCSKCK